MALDLATIAAPPARDETPARPGPAKESAAVLAGEGEHLLVVRLLGFWRNLGLKKRKLLGRILTYL